ncbi:MAG: hypothetical protein FJ279_31260, partial [Planctomycetes bacterium]|nr:hypothetical protein [Planctomycetota bacterium]
YGKEAAPAMLRYFSQAEKIYERRRTPDEYRITYHRPGERQFEHAQAGDFALMAQALEEAARLVQGEANRTRVDFVARCFQWGRYYWQQYDALQRLGSARAQSDGDVENALKLALSFDEAARVRESYYKEKIEPLAPYCVYAQDPKKVDWHMVDPMFTWAKRDEAMDAGFAAVTAFKRQTQTVQQAAAFWNDVSQKHGPLKPFADTQRLRLIHPNAALKNLLSNGSFEEPPGELKPDDKPQVAKDWPIYHNRMVNATVALDRAVKHDGNISVTAKGLTDYSGLMRHIRVKSQARYRLSFWYLTTSETRHAFYGIMVNPQIREHIPPVDQWTRFEKVFTVSHPKAAEATFLILLCLRHGGSEKSQVWFDDVRLEMLAPEGVEQQ